MPTPEPNETQDDYMGRCIPIVLKEGTAKDNDQAVAICSSMWKDAHKSIKNTNVKLISQDADTATVAGYGVVFGGKDLEGEFFTPDTEFMLDVVPTKLVFYDHAMQKEVTHVIGKAKATLDDNGLWVEAQLDLHKRYVAEVLELVNQGILGWSSGTASHLIEKSAGFIKRWPIIEFSLTPTPAEPRTIGVQRLKALALEHPELKALIPQETGEVSGNAATAVSAEKSTIKKTMETITMSDKPEVTLSMEEYKSMLQAMAKAPDAAPPKPVESNDPAIKALDAKMAKLSEQIAGITSVIEKSPILKDAGYVAPDSEADDADVKSFGDFLVAVKNGNHTRLTKVYGAVKDTERETKSGSKTALAESAGSTGGYIVPTQLVAPIFAAAESFSVLRRAGATIVPMNAKGAEVPALDVETAPSAGDTAYAAGVVAYWADEAAALTESEPRFRMIELVNHKLAGYSLASNEVREDAGASIDGLMSSMFGRAVGAKENYAFFRGDGVSKPKGILLSGAYSNQARHSATTVALTDLALMMSAFIPTSWGKGCWFANPGVMDQILQLISAPLSWLPDLRTNPGSLQLLGMPLYITGALPALGTSGDFMLVDPSYYLIGDRRQLTIAFSEHYKFLNDQGTWRFTSRVDGQPWINGSITLENASTTVAAFIGLTG